MINPGKLKKTVVKRVQKKPETGKTAAAPLVSGFDKKGDLSDFGIPVEEMIRRCRGSGHTVWAYARVSTLAQDLTRQVDRFLELGIDAADIVQDKATGTNFERDGFKRLMESVREGDIILFTELDRFGRDFMENVNFAMRITLEKKVGIGFIANPELNRMGRQSELYALISMMMFLMQAYSSYDEHEKIMSRTSQGRKVKAKEGAAFGRKPRDVTDRFWEMEEGILNGSIPQRKAGKELGVNYRTLKKWIRHARKQRMRKGIEKKARDLSEQAKEWCNEAVRAGAPFSSEIIFEVKELVDRFIANVGILAESLSSWRRKPVVDKDGTIIRPATYQRKETELDAEVEDLEANVEGIKTFTDQLIGILKNPDGVFEPAAVSGGHIKSINGIGDIKNEEDGKSEKEEGRDSGNEKSEKNASDNDSNAKRGAEPNGLSLKKLLATLLKIMKRLERKLAALKARLIE